MPPTNFSPPPAFSQILFSFFLLLLLGLPRLSNAQSVDDCYGWAIEVSASPALNIQNQLGQSTTTCSDGSACSDLYYYVSLVRSGDENGLNGPALFRFFELHFLGNLSITPNNTTITTRKLSHLDASASQACSPADVNTTLEAPIASWDANGNFAYDIISTAEIDWQITGRRLLFVIAVHAYPGEVVDLAGMAGSFNLVTVPQGCGAIVTTAGNLAKTLPTVNGCSQSSFQLLIGSSIAANIPGFPNSVKFPIYVNGGSTNTTYSVQSLDFLLGIETDMSTSAMSIEGNVIPGTAITLYNESGPMKRRVYVSAQNFSVPGGTGGYTPAQTLFYIVINGAPLAGGCVSGRISFLGSRPIKATASNLPLSDCCEARIGNNQNFTVGPVACLSTCANSVSLQITKSLVQTGTDPCHDLFFALKIRNDGTTPISYQSGSVVFDLDYNNIGSLNALTPVPVDIAFQSASVSSTTVGQVLRLTFNFTASTSINLAAGAQKTLAVLPLYGSNVCVNSITFYNAYLYNGVQDCLPGNVSTEIGVLPGQDVLCLQSLALSFKKAYGTDFPVEEVKFTVKDQLSACEVGGVGDADGLGTACLCNSPKQAISALKVNNPLNGVSTFDLVLISRHILGLEPLNSPYKLIAADANNTGSITTSDIVELRKLILGIYQELPSNDSWRFVGKDYVFPNPQNPFDPALPLSYPFSLPLSSTLIIYGIKIGDVNGDAGGGLLDSHIADRDKSTLTMNYASPASQRNEVTEIPLFLQQSADLSAWQLALHYDTNQLKVRNIRWAASAESDIYQWGDWNAPTPGELRLSWFDRAGAAIHIPAQTPLAYVQVEWLGNHNHYTENALQLATTLPSEAYNSNGQAAGFALSFVAQYQVPVIPAKVIQLKPTWTVSAYPNPTSGVFRFDISLPGSGKGTISVYDPIGQLVTQQHCSFTAGLNVVTSQQFPPLPTGVYFVRFDTPMGRQTLRLVKK